MGLRPGAGCGFCGRAGGRTANVCRTVGAGRKSSVPFHAELHKKGGKSFQQLQAGADGGTSCAGRFLQLGDARPRALADAEEHQDDGVEDKSGGRQVIAEAAPVHEGIPLAQDGRIQRVDGFAIADALEGAVIAPGCLKGKVAVLRQGAHGLHHSRHGDSGKAGDVRIGLAARSQRVGLSEQDAAGAARGEGQAGVAY